MCLLFPYQIIQLPPVKEGGPETHHQGGGVVCPSAYSSVCASLPHHPIIATSTTALKQSALLIDPYLSPSNRPSAHLNQHAEDQRII